MTAGAEQFGARLMPVPVGDVKRSRSRLAPRWASVAIVCAAAAAVGLVWSAPRNTAFTPSGRRPAAATHAAWWSALPVAARASVSAALGHSERAYRVAGDAAANPVQRLALRFSARGAVTVATGTTRTWLGLTGVGRGHEFDQVDLAGERTSENRVSYATGSVREWFVNGPIGLEQGFGIARRPAGAGGPLALRVGLAHGVRVSVLGPDSALLRLPGGSSLRYTGLSAVDARGRPLHAWLDVRSGGLEILVDDAGASYPLRVDPFVQQGGLIDPDTQDQGSFGASVAVSGDGSTAIVGSPGDNSNTGRAWVFTDDDGTWIQQGPELVGDCTKSCANEGTGESSGGGFGISVALSDNGNTALIGASGNDPNDTGGDGAVWVFTRTGTAWTEQTELFAGTGSTNGSQFGYSVALTPAGTTALIGAPSTDSGVGGAWVYTESGGKWTEQGAELAGSCTDTCSDVGYSVALDSAGTTAMLGAPGDGTGSGGVLVFTESAGSWSQQGSELVGDCTGNGNICAHEGRGESGAGNFGWSVALSGPGTMALVGAIQDTGGNGAVWVFKYSASAWSEQTELVGDCQSSCTNQGTKEQGPGEFGSSVALSSDASTAVIGAADDDNMGAAWVFTNSGSSWTQSGAKLVGDCLSSCTNEGSGEVGSAGFGFTVGMSSTGAELFVGGPDNGSDSQIGAAWAFGPATAPPTSTTTRLVSPGSSMPGQQVKFTATVSPTPNGGTVSFTDNNNAVSDCTGLQLSGGTVSCEITFATGGDYDIKANYSGDSKYGSSYGLVNQEVALISTSTDVTSSPSTPVAGEPITYTATTTPEPDGGTIKFTDNGTTITGCGAVPVSQGYATCKTTAPSTVGATESIVATYSGSEDYAPSASTALAQTVGKIPTTVTISTSPNPSGLGQDITLTMKVSPVPDGGTVSIDAYDYSICGGCALPTWYDFSDCNNVPLTGGVATCLARPGNTDEWYMRATYNGDATYGRSQGSTLTTVLPAAPVDLTVTPQGGSQSGSATAEVPECGRLLVAVAARDQTAPGSSKLTVTASGDSSAFSNRLFSSTLAKNGVTQLYVASSCSSVGTVTYTLAATVTGYAPATATVTVTSYQVIKSIVVDHSPGPGADAYGMPMTPQFGHPGSEVTIQLPTLPAGTQVSTIEFGILDATALPVIQDPSAGWVKAQIPLFATTGTVTVNTNHGDYSTTSPYQIDNFRDVWGLPFVNVGMPPGYVNVKAAVAIFGDGQVYNQQGFETPAAQAWIANTQSFEGGGMCYGFGSFTQAAWALKVKHHVDLADDYPNTGNTPYDVNSAGNPSVAAYQAVATGEISQNVPAFYNYEASQTDESTSIPAQRTVDELRADWQAMRTGGTSAAKKLPFLVLFNQGTGGGGHVVVPYNIERDGSGYAIDVFNENEPYAPSELSGNRGFNHVLAVEDSRIIVRADGSWTFADGFSPTWEGDKYHLYVQTLGQVYNPLYPDGLSNATLTETDSDLGITVPTAAGLSQVTDSHGRRLINPSGTQNTNSSSDIPGATLGNELTSGATPGPQQAVLPPDRSYAVTLAGTSAAQLTGNGLDATVQLGAQPGVHDRIGVTAQQGQLTIATGGHHSTPLTVGMVTGSSTQHSLDLTTTSEPGGQDTIAFTGPNVVLRHTGATAPVTIGLTTLTRSGVPQTGSFGPISLSDGQTLTLTPKAGTGYGEASVTVTGPHGRGTRVVRSNLPALRAPAVPVVRVARGSHGTWLLTIKARTRAQSAGAQLTLVWIVRRHGRVVSEHELALPTHRLPPAISETFSLGKLPAGSYTFTGEVIAERAHGVTQQARDASARRHFRVG